MKPHHRIGKIRASGSALVITLAFIVLLTAVMLLFLSQALSYRSWSNSNFNDFKSSALGQSALEIVVGDLRQEIVNGSAPTTYGSGTNTTTLYTVTNNFYAVPQRSGTNYVGAVDTTPNLTRISIRSDPIAYPGVGSRASAVSSTNAALGGQYVAMARWNKHYLIPRASAGSGSLDTTPTNTFNPPDWVFVTSGGPTVLTSPSTSVIGRYAYAIYDEGGLLDANVAGTPSNTATNSTTFPNNPNHDVVWGSGLKGSEAFADLTMTNSAGTPILTQAQIDQLIAWRNNATITASGSFSGYTLPASAPVVYHDYAVNNTNGFLVTSGALNGTTTDQVFTSRQSLIAYALAAGWSQDSLQYFATFTRDTDQPNYTPPVGRPMVQNTTAPVGGSPYNVAPFGTGNDAWHFDRVSTSPTANDPTDINPPLLAVRVTTSSFKRPDGTTAQVGDALLKKRFPLSRLSLITSTATATQSQSDPIYRNFGIYRSDATKPWIYDHDTTATPGGIDKLSIVASLQREPDFFELLKAAINIGSIGKGDAWGNSNTATDNWTLGGSIGYITQHHDNITALQILQIGANIIDQSKSDDFPTRIQFGRDPTVPPLEVRGSEDLPYIYRIRNWFTQYVTTPTGGTGQIAYLIQPELWDPYAYSSSTSAGLGSSGFVTTGNRPTQFRARLEPDPTVAPSSGAYAGSPVSCVVTYQRNNPAPPPATLTDTITEANVTLNSPNYQNANLTITSTPPAPAMASPSPITFNAGEPNYWGFREPTVLAMTTAPSTANISAATLSGTLIGADVNTHSTMCGFVISTFPTVNLAVSTTDAINKVNLQPNSEPSCLRLYLDYQDSHGNWITYDEGPFQYMGGSGSWDLHTIFNYHTYAAADAALDWYGWTRTDPRTSRWGAYYTEYLDDYQPIDISNSEFETARSTGGISYGSHLGQGRQDAGFYTYNSYATSSTHPFRGAAPGYAPENSVRTTYQTDTGDTDLRYNLDPDGIPRRNMAGYATDTANGGVIGSSTASVPGLPMNTAVLSGDYSARPTILHRPFRTVAELGYAFRETPWGNINFSFPESADSALLDVFCINESSDSNGMVAGRVNLNTRQVPVIAALLSNSLRDKDDSSVPVLSQAMASNIAAALVARTVNPPSVANYGPMASRAELVGKWIGSINPTTSKSNLAAASPIDPSNFYTGFSSDIGTVPGVKGTPTALITRQRESVMRALADAGTTRTWNLLIDLVAQSGRFSSTATTLNNFTVEGEKHYWLHVAIDRATGKIIDSQLEVVKE